MLFDKLVYCRLTVFYFLFFVVGYGIIIDSVESDFSDGLTVSNICSMSLTRCPNSTMVVVIRARVVY